MYDGDEALYEGFNRQATLQALRDAGLGCSLQAQVLSDARAANIDYRAFDIGTLSDGNALSAAFAAIADDIGRKRCPSA